MILASGGGGEGGVTATCCMPPMTISSDRGMAFEQPVVPARGLARARCAWMFFGRFARGCNHGPPSVSLFPALQASCGSVHCAIQRTNAHIYARHTRTHTLLERSRAFTPHN